MRVYGGVATVCGHGSHIVAANADGAANMTVNGEDSRVVAVESLQREARAA
ncbi:hypothetical protein PR003_g12058 [Phytophthora rubi]|uniref:Uncharacterized protein n=1 Tax=Phytophthora rubi TaxID=129364 RepID=A0A6A4FDX9_9STRA|nr:hypothetical protein PR003_g12058 [Phytophthora rubi]